MKNQQIMAPQGSEVFVPPITVKYCLYARKSTEQDERQALSIESQVKEMLQIAEREGLEIIDIRREAHSAKDSGQRPAFKELLDDIRRGRYNGILTWAPDRLSRNAGDLGSLVDLMDQKQLVEIRTYGQHFTNSPNEKFLLMILCSQAKLENDNKSINVKRGLRTRVEMGLWPAPAPTGYFKEKRMDRKCETLIDSERAPIIKQMFEKVAYEKWSGRKLYHWLKFDLNFKTATGNKNLTISNVYTILQNHFYYGVFEYPKNSGNWYQGKHEPIITKELFDMVQAQVKSQFIRSETKEFAFTKLMTCGLCGSGITANENFKKQKNGNFHRHVYYGCTKVRDKECKCGYIKEDELIKQLEVLIEKIDIDEIGIKGVK
jgi:site-specific DNA recombinase